MPLNITSEIYNGQQGLYANAGDWIEAEATFRTRFSVGSGTSNKFSYNNIAGDYQLTLQQGNAQDWGFIAGDTIILRYYIYVGATAFLQVFTTTVLYTTGSSVFIADEFTFAGGTQNHINGRQFPTENYTSGLLIYADKQPDSLEFWFNLTPNGSALMESVVDSELSRFSLENAQGIPTGVPQPMAQLISFSGSYVKDIDVTLTATPGEGWRQYRVRWKFLQWGVIKDGFTEPNYYDNADCLAPVFRVKAFSQFGNPNGVNISTSDNTESNTGGFDENYNGALSLYQSTGITWEDSLGNPIQALDYSGTCTFEATVEAPNQNDPLSTYRLGLLWRPIDGTYYQNIQTFNLGNNLLVLAPENDFIADGNIDANIYLGEENSSGARWDLTNVTFTLSGTTLTITGTIIPNAQATVLFAGVPDGGRLSTLWLSLGDYTLDSTFNSKRVSLQLFNDDNIDAPTLGVQIPDVIDEVLLDHAGIDITLPLPQTTTEDDVLYRSNFHLLDNLNYEGVRAEIMAYNTTTEEQFTLEDIFFSFNSVPFIAGQFQPNFNVPRGFNLPPLSDRNHISLTREPSLDIAGKYALKLEYGYLSRWEYWLEQANANNDFFDILEYAFDGKNKNWQRFSNSGDWIVRLAYYTRLNGVDDFNYEEIGIRPYEDDINVSTTWGIEVLSNNTFPTNLLADELHEVTATLVWTIGAYTNPWAEITIEDFEAGNRWVISSVLAQGGIANNPLQPIVGQTGLDMTFPSVNIAVLKTYIDTNIISANKVCVSARIYSEDEPIPPTWEWLLTESKEALVAYSDARRLGLFYTGDLMRVRRASDNTEQDIPYIQIGAEWVLDEENLLDFTGRDLDANGWIVTRYNQAIQGSADATQSFMNRQPPIVQGGQVIKDPISNRPAHLCNGHGHYHNIAGGVPVEEKFKTFTVFADLTLSLVPRFRIGIGNLGFTNPSTMTWFLSPTQNVLYSQFTTPRIDHFIGDQANNSFIVLTWGEVNGVTTSQVEARKNGVFGLTQIEDNLNGFSVDTVDAHSKNFFHQGYKSEDAIYGNNVFQTEIWIENNVNNFYQIF